MISKTFEVTFRFKVESLGTEEFLKKEFESGASAEDKESAMAWAKEENEFLNYLPSNKDLLLKFIKNSIAAYLGDGCGYYEMRELLDLDIESEKGLFMELLESHPNQELKKRYLSQVLGPDIPSFIFESFEAEVEDVRLKEID